MARTPLQLVSLGALVAASACFDPSFREGLPCSEELNCPPEQYCDLATQRCFSTVEGDLDRPVLLSSFLSTTGWRDENGAPITLQFAPAEAGAILECRTGPTTTIGMLDFRPCDGATGTEPVHLPEPDPTFPEGSYETQARARKGKEVSALFVYPFYAHTSLDQVPTCTSSYSDQDAFREAALALQPANPFPNDTITRNPFIEIPFENVTVSDGMIKGSGWSPDLVNYRAGVLSLRRKFVLSEDRTLLAVRRQYESRRARLFDSTHSCRNGFHFGARSGNPFPRALFDCEFLVLNSRGQSVCLIDNGTSLTAGPLNETGWVKLTQKQNFSAKGAQDCPNCVPWFLVLPP